MLPNGFELSRPARACACTSTILYQKDKLEIVPSAGSAAANGYPGKCFQKIRSEQAINGSYPMYIIKSNPLEGHIPKTEDQRLVMTRD